MEFVKVAEDLEHVVRRDDEGRALREVLDEDAFPVLDEDGYPTYEPAPLGEDGEPVDPSTHPEPAPGGCEVWEGTRRADLSVATLEAILERFGDGNVEKVELFDGGRPVVRIRKGGQP